MYIHARLNAKSPFIFDIHFEITFKNAGLRVPGRIIVRNEKPKGSQTPRENEWFWFLDSGRRQWLLAQPFFIQNDLVEVKAMNSRVGRRKETTNFSTVILGSDQETLAKQSCCQEPSGKEGRQEGWIESQKPRIVSDQLGEIEGRRTQQILERLVQQMRESQADKVFQYVGEAN